MDAHRFVLTEWCDARGRFGRELTRAGDAAQLSSDYIRVGGASSEWEEAPDDLFDTSRPYPSRVRHAAKENAREVRRAWKAVCAAREHPLSGTPAVDGEESFHHAVLSAFVRWFAEYGILFPALPLLPFTEPDTEGELTERLLLKAPVVRRMLSVGDDRLRDLIAEGRLVPVRFDEGGDRYFTRRSVEAFVEDLERDGYRR